jgi:CheY-like chemotaxis protein
MSTRHIPVVIDTAWSMACNIEERIHRALNAGAEEVLYKPFQFPMLRNVLAHLFVGLDHGIGGMCSALGSSSRQHHVSGPET